MKNILIKTHNCTLEEYQNLTMYLEDECWDFKEVEVDFE